MNQSYDASSPMSKKLRKMAGTYIKSCREGQGLTQRDLAEALKLKYYTFISQLENGHGRVPPHLYEPLAVALRQDVKVFVMEMLKFYDPSTYKALNGEHPYNLMEPTNKVWTQEEGKNGC